jgi:hypothetical protein
MKQISFPDEKVNILTLFFDSLLSDSFECCARTSAQRSRKAPTSQRLAVSFFLSRAVSFQAVYACVSALSSLLMRFGLLLRADSCLSVFFFFSFSFLVLNLQWHRSQSQRCLAPVPEGLSAKRTEMGGGQEERGSESGDIGRILPCEFGAA